MYIDFFQVIREIDYFRLIDNKKCFYPKLNDPPKVFSFPKNSKIFPNNTQPNSESKTHQYVGDSVFHSRACHSTRKSDPYQRDRIQVHDIWNIPGANNRPTQLYKLTKSEDHTKHILAQFALSNSPGKKVDWKWQI